jgi:UDP-N-acetylglucosamine 1-carboxyvinyltransferase
MDKFVIEGGRALRGSVRTAGSKNAVLPVLAASLLTDEPLVIPNAPRVADVTSMLKVLESLGSRAVQNADGSVEVCASHVPGEAAGWEFVRKMRGSVSVLGPLLARTHRACVAMPGGCVIGVRPVDLHIKGMRALGATVTLDEGEMRAEATKGLKGAEMYLGGAQGSTVLGTGNVMMAATLAKGTTVIHGAACEPEVVDLGHCLNKMGARITGLGSPRIEIEGVARLHGATHEVIPDRIEAGTYVIAGAITGSAVRVEACRPDHLMILLERLTEAGIAHEVGPDWIATLPYDTRARRPKPTDVTTLAYPGFPTDLQAQWMALMTLAGGMSLITETIYSDRYMHVAELLRMGANVRRQTAMAIVNGPAQLSGAEVMASDLRASAVFVLAGLVARGTTEVHRVYHIDRGYERIEERLKQLGAAIERVDDRADARSEEPGAEGVLTPQRPPRAAMAQNSAEKTPITGGASV